MVAPLIARTAGATVLAIGCGFLLFPTEASLIGVVLVAFAKASTVEGLLDDNRRAIWDEHVAPARANLRLAASLLLIFLAVFAVYVGAVQLAPEDQLEGLFGRQLGDFAAGGVHEVRFGTLTEILARNAVVFAGCFVFSLVYQHAGMLLVLAWNASAWGVIFSYLARTAADHTDLPLLPYLARTLAVVLPHLLLEAVAYILVAMAGVFLARGLRHGLSSDPFARVAAAVLRIAALAAAILVAAAAFEALVTPRLVSALFG